MILITPYFLWLIPCVFYMAYPLHGGHRVTLFFGSGTCIP
ncbi:conserved domain protein [Megasphaera sp. UPII 135-E]|uniref:Uncharacterized protein n=1 Tax=Megasphaera hutchinsoni TaxID=1588748 RepID=A0A134CLR5_9FIRM|nr:conserved domain protein [Megasphaera sp. UPII 135-E]KXB93125.1 hypothetical protein HMPREF3182_00041 [Megasphaera hutchinsoni]